MSRVKWRSGSGGGGVGKDGMGEQCGRGMERRRGKVGILEDEMKGGGGRSVRRRRRQKWRTGWNNGNIKNWRVGFRER